MQRQVRPYQTAAIEKLRKLWRTPINPDKPNGPKHTDVVFVAPVGAGKTEMALMVTERVIQNPDFDVFFLGHRQELIDQPSRRYNSVGLRHDIIKASVPKHCSRCRSPNPYGVVVCGKCSLPIDYARIQVASVQTLYNRASVKTGRRYAIVFVDEGHRCKARQYQKILEALRACYEQVFFVYLTATPYRLDGKGLGDMASTILEAATPRELIQNGYILDPKVYTRPTPKFDQSAVVAGDFSDSVVYAQYESPKLYADIVDTWRKHHHGLPGLGFGINRAHCEHLVERFREGGFRAEYVNGDTPSNQRRRALARLAIGGPGSTHPEALDVLINVDLFTEGFDSESSYGLITDSDEFKDLWLRRSYPPEYQPLAIIGDWAPTLSMGKYIQRLGRCTRMHARKPGAWFLSHAGNVDRHCFLEQHEGFTLTQDKETNPILKRIIREQKGVALKVCLLCGISNKADAFTCRECGSSTFEIIKKDDHLFEETEGELVEVKADPKKVRPFTQGEAERWLTDQYTKWKLENSLLIDQGKAPRKIGYVAHLYKGIQGAFPSFDITNKVKQALGLTKAE